MSLIFSLLYALQVYPALKAQEPTRTLQPPASTAQTATAASSPQVLQTTQPSQASQVAPGESSEHILNSVHQLLESSPRGNEQKTSPSSSNSLKDKTQPGTQEVVKQNQVIQEPIDEPSQASASKQRVSLTLQECWQRALSSNSRIRLARESLEQAKGVVVEAKSTLYPQLGSTARLYEENKDVFDQQQPPTDQGFREKWSATLFVQQSLYSGGVNRNNIAIAKLEQEVEFIHLEETINNVLFEVTSAFYEVLVGRSDVDTHRQTVELLRKEVARQKGLFEAGRVTKFQVLRAEVRLSNEIPGLIEAENTVRTSTMNLVELLGKSSLDQLEDRAIHVQGQLNCPPLHQELEELITQAIERSPAISEQAKKLEVARRQASIARAAILPRINLFAGLSAKHDAQEESEHGFLEHHVDAVAGVMGTWNLFDGFEGKGKAMQAEAQAQIAEIAGRRATRSIEFNVRRAYLDLKQAQGAVQAQEGNVQKASEAVGLAISSADAGFGTQFEVLEAKVDLATARNVELRARRQYHLALAALDKLLYTRLAQFQPFLEEKTQGVSKKIESAREAEPAKKSALLPTSHSS